MPGSGVSFVDEKTDFITECESTLETRLMIRATIIEPLGKALFTLINWTRSVECGGRLRLGGYVIAGVDTHWPPINHHATPSLAYVVNLNFCHSELHTSNEVFECLTKYFDYTRSRFVDCALSAPFTAESFQGLLLRGSSPENKKPSVVYALDKHARELDCHLPILWMALVAQRDRLAKTPTASSEFVEVEFRLLDDMILRLRAFIDSRIKAAQLRERRLIST